jgi:starch phosphorylase
MLPLYYDSYDTWRQIAWNGMRDVRIQFESGRMAEEYYNKLYNKKVRH